MDEKHESFPVIPPDQLPLPPPGIELPSELPFIGAAPDGWAPKMTSEPPAGGFVPPAKPRPAITAMNTVCLRHCRHYMETHDALDGDLEDIGQPLVGVARTCLRLSVPVEGPVHECTQYDPITMATLVRREKLAQAHAVHMGLMPPRKRGPKPGSKRKGKPGKVKLASVPMPAGKGKTIGKGKRHG